MQFKIHGHACLEVISQDKSLICDPWLLGSCYWQSWWNYPPLEKDIIDKLNVDYIYITHLHWDHFHAPTLRKIGLDKTVIIPKTPELKLLKDIRAIGFKNIIELNHGDTLKLTEKFKITSYQFGPILTDSILIIEADNYLLFNSNDAKIMGLPLKQILAKHPEIDFVFRSHSSANLRLCYELTDEEGKHLDDLAKYSQEFAQFTTAVKAKYAIPFASNHCYLHPETFKFNQYTNYAPKVKEYFEQHQIKTPQCIVMAPGDYWDSQTGFYLQNNEDWYTNLERKVSDYQRSKKTTLEQTLATEATEAVKIKLVEKYAQWLFKETPWIIRQLFKNHPITLVSYNAQDKKAFRLDLAQKKLDILHSWNPENNPIQIIIPARVLNDVLAKKHWNSLGVSKRLTIKTTKSNVQYVTLFNFLNNGLEVGSLQLKNILTPRYLFTYLKRWREILLYIQIIMDLFIRKNFQYNRYF